MNRQEQQAAWFLAYETELIKLAPSTIGKVDWATARYYYNSRWAPNDAARSYYDSNLQLPPTP